MIIRHSTILLEQITEIEKEISKLEYLMEKMGVDCDRDKMLEVIVNCQKLKSSWQSQKN